MGVGSLKGRGGSLDRRRRQGLRLGGECGRVGHRCCSWRCLWTGPVALWDSKGDI